MFRLLLFLVLVFGIYVVLYGTPAVASIDASIPPSMHGTMADLHASAWASIDRGWDQLKTGLAGFAQALASSFHR